MNKIIVVREKVLGRRSSGFIDISTAVSEELGCYYPPLLEIPNTKTAIRLLRGLLSIKGYAV